MPLLACIAQAPDTVPIIEAFNDQAGALAGAEALLTEAPDTTAVLAMSDVLGVGMLAAEEAVVDPFGAIDRLGSALGKVFARGGVRLPERYLSESSPPFSNTLTTGLLPRRCW